MMEFKRLPHVDHCMYYQFVTFRTLDSVDGFLQGLFLQDLPNDMKQASVDRYADSSVSGAYLNDDVLVCLSDFLLANKGGWYELVAFAVMPNHVHVLFKSNMPLPRVMQFIKGGSAKLINALMGRSGHFWAKNYYDKSIRDQAHFDCVYRYIKHNPMVLSEANQAKRFYGIFEGE